VPFTFARARTRGLPPAGISISLALWLGLGCSSAPGSTAGAPLDAPVLARLDPPGASARRTGCPLARLGVEVGRLADPTLNEISGIAASQQNPGLFWVHNDSGDRARIFAISRRAGRVLELRLQGAYAHDYEDIALGPGPDSEDSTLYVADIGDNFRRRKSVQIYWFHEPQLDPSGPASRPQRVHRLELTYEDGPQDAEALFSDPRTGDLYIVAKQLFVRAHDRPTGVYRVARAELLGERVRARKVGMVPMGAATGADILPDGSAIVIRNYVSVRYWPRSAEQSVAEALTATPCELPLVDLGWVGEAIAFSPDGRGYYTLSEGARRPLYFYEFAGDR
jgi:hypothetical protein